MNFALKPITVALLVATIPLTGVANAQGPKPLADPDARSALAATKTPIPTKAPEDLIIYEEITFTPVEKPQHHFTSAVKAYAKKSYKTAAADIHKATSYLRLEAGRAVGEAKQELESSVVQLDALAASVEKGAVKDMQSITKVFAKASHALALEHRSKAVESWAHKEYNKAGYELKAAAHGFESAAGWVGEEVKAGASATVADTRALGNKLASGATWTRDEVAKGFESLGNSINALGEKIGSTKKAPPADL